MDEKENFLEEVLGEEVFDFVCGNRKSVEILETDGSYTVVLKKPKIIRKYIRFFKGKKNSEKNKEEILPDVRGGRVYVNIEDFRNYLFEGDYNFKKSFSS